MNVIIGSTVENLVMTHEFAIISGYKIFGSEIA